VAGKTDQMKGNAKEAVGDLTGNKDLKGTVPLSHTTRGMASNEPRIPY